MAISAGSAGRSSGQGGAQRHSDDRRHAGAADHLHDRDAADRRRLQGHDAEGQEPRRAARGRERGHPRHRRRRAVLPERQGAGGPGRAGGPAQGDVRRPHRGQDPVLQGRQSAQVRPDPGSRRDWRGAPARGSWRRSPSRKVRAACSTRPRRRTDMAGGASAGTGRSQLGAQRHPDDRHHAGDADHLHGLAAAVAHGDRRPGAAAGDAPPSRPRSRTRSCWS